MTLAGFSFGSRTGTGGRLNDDRVKRLISIGTPVDKYGDYDISDRGLKKPILFVHGDQDEFGSVENLKKLVDQGFKKHRYELDRFRELRPFFDEHLNELRETMQDWVLNAD